MKDLKFFFLLFLKFFKRYTSRVFLTKSKKNIVLFFLILAALLVLGKLGLNYYSTPLVYEGLVGTYSQNNLPVTITNLISEPLVRLDKTGQPQPNLVSGWQVNNNSTIYIFKLKDNLFWNDGSKLKATDIKFNLPDVEISYPDDKTIEFKLADSFAPFPTFLVSPILKENSLVGIGKYQVNYLELSQGAVIKLVLNPKNSQDNLPSMSIRFYPDEKTAKIAFELGEIDAIFGLTSSEDLLTQPSIKEKKLPVFNKLVATYYNTKDPLLSDKNLRRALSYATPQVSGEDRAKTSIPPSFWGYNGEVKDYLYNLELAKTSLEKVNLEKGKTITLTTTPAFSLLGEKIIQSWKQIGIEAILRIESGIPQNFQALLIPQPIPVDPDQYTFWHSTQTLTNLSKYSFARIDKDLEDGRKISDIKLRKEKYADFQKVLLEDAPATFLYFPKFNIVYRGKIENELQKIINHSFF